MTGVGVVEAERRGGVTGPLYRHEGQPQVVTAGLGLDTDVESQEAKVKQAVLAQGVGEQGGENVCQTQAVQNIREGKLILLAGISKADCVVVNKFNEKLGL